jgi:hypothetical protein
MDLVMWLITINAYQNPIKTLRMLCGRILRQALVVYLTPLYDDPLNMERLKAQNAESVKNPQQATPSISSA